MTSEKESLPRRYSEEEVAAFLERATELQRAGSDREVGEGLTLEELEEIAAEAGIPPRYVRRAAAELDSTSASTGNLWAEIAGASLTISFERTVEVEIEPKDLGELVPLVEAESLGQGTAGVVGRTLTLTSRSETTNALQQVSVTTGGGRTVVRAEERLGWLAAALHGGIIGGVGGGAGIGGGVALGTALGSAALSVAIPVVVVGGSYAAARWIYGFQVKSRKKRLATLVDRLAERVERLGSEPDTPWGEDEID